MAEKVGRFELLVELRDAHYPVSIYMLAYQPEKNRLHGICYQAAMGQMFEVEYVRTD